MGLSLFQKGLRLLYKSWTTYVTIGVSILLLAIYFVVFVRVDHVEIIDFVNKNRVSFFSDKTDGGQSYIIKTSVTDSSIRVTYRLKSGFVTPYAGMTINDLHGKRDFSKYNKIRLRLKGKGIDNVYIHVTTKDEQVKDKSHRLADRISAVNLSLKDGAFDQDISFDQFETPTWWSHAIHQSINDFGAIGWDQLLTISVVSGISYTLGTDQEIELSSMVFYNDYLQFKTAALLIVFLILLVLFLYHLNIAKRSEVKTLIIEYKPTLESIKGNNESDAVLAYIHEHYSDPELSLSKVAKSVGMPERNVSKIIHEKYLCNFRTYINNIRVAEAERLLKSSGLSVSEVGYKVGFNDPSSFSKTFKKIVGSPPSAR